MKLQLSLFVLALSFFISSTYAYECGEIKDSPCYCEDIGEQQYNFKCLSVESSVIANYLSCDTTADPDPKKCEGIVTSPGENRIKSFGEFSIVPVLDSNNVEDPKALEEIQADILGGKTARSIRITTLNPYDYKIKINSKAFTSTLNYTEELIIFDGDLVGVNWEFLNNFTKLQTIHLQGITDGIGNFASSLPTLSSVKNLMMVNCKDAHLVPKTSRLPNLTHLSSIDNKLSDAIIPSVFTELAGAKLEYISLRKNLLSVYPINVNQFPTLHSIDLSDNSIVSLDTTYSMKFTAQVQQVDLSRNKITLISKKEVFAGDFSQAIVKLDGNQLPTLDGNVFFELTQNMTSGGGNLYVKSNKLICDCPSVGWLIHDNYYLIPKTVDGDCDYSGVTRKFSELSPSDEAFKNCNTEFTTSTTTTTVATTTEMTTTEPPTTISTTTDPPTASVSMTTNPTTPPPDDTYQEQLAALFGLFGGLFLIIIIGFAIMFSKLNKAKKVAVGGAKRKDSIESGPKPPATNPQLIGGYSTQQPQQMPTLPPQQMTTFTQPKQQQQSVLPRISMPPAQPAQTNGNAASTYGQSQPRGLRRMDY